MRRAVAGALPLLLWRPLGESVEFGATNPGSAFGTGWALLGEIGATAALVVLLITFVGHARLRRYTPLLFPALYALLVWLEAPVSGASTNPAQPGTGGRG